jgi:adenine nucleotide transporter 17
MANKAVVEGFSGGMGSLIALFATYPLKTIYTLQAIRAVKEERGAKYSSEDAKELLRNPSKVIAALLRRSARNVGVLYAGLKPAAVETASSSAIYFFFYSVLRQAVVANNRRARGDTTPSGSSRTEDIGVVASLLVAAIAGAGNMLITTPAAVITTQMQARSKAKQHLESEGHPSHHIRSDTWGVCQQIYQDNGVTGFWQGKRVLKVKH